MAAGGLREGNPDHAGDVFGVLLGCGEGGPDVAGDGQKMDEVEPAERAGSAGACRDLVLCPAQPGTVREGGDIEIEFFLEFAGEGDGYFFVRVEETARQ